MSEIKDYFTGIAIGIKYRPNFSIEDNLGGIIDELLYRKNSLFNYITFPMTDTGLGEKKLHDPKTGSNFFINSTNLILDINFSDKIPKQESNNIINEFFNAATEKIYKIVNIQEINFIGIVNKYMISDESLLKNLFTNFEKITFSDVDTISLNFTRKIVLPETKTNRDINDFENIIHTLVIPRKSNKGYFLQIDYQKIFNPMLASIIDIQYKDFIVKADRYNNVTINEWINRNEKKK
jgi:hypothetical protein